MKKLLLILLCLPLIGFGQTDKVWINKAQVYYDKAEVYYDKAQYEDAIANYTKVLEEPYNGNTLLSVLGRAYAYAKLEQYAYAIDDYTRILRSSPDYAYTYIGRGIAYAKLEQYEDAIADYTKAIRIYNDSDAETAEEAEWLPRKGAYGYYWRGDAYFRAGKPNDALDDLTRAIRIDPDYAYAYKDRALVKEEIGLPYCSDFKRACDLGNEDCCEWYKEDNCK